MSNKFELYWYKLFLQRFTAISFIFPYISHLAEFLWFFFIFYFQIANAEKCNNKLTANKSIVCKRRRWTFMRGTDRKATNQFSSPLLFPCKTVANSVPFQSLKLFSFRNHFLSTKNGRSKCYFMNFHFSEKTERFLGRFSVLRVRAITYIRMLVILHKVTCRHFDLKYYWN